MPKIPMAIRLSPEAIAQLERLAKIIGSKAEVFETAIRDLARKHKIK